MATETAIIKIPSAVINLQEFARLERISMRTAYKWTTGETPKVPIEKRIINKGKTKAGGNVRVYYARYKEQQAKEAFGHSRFQIVIENPLMMDAD